MRKIVRATFLIILITLFGIAISKLNTKIVKNEELDYQKIRTDLPLPTEEEIQQLKEQGPVINMAVGEEYSATLFYSASVEYTWEPVYNKKFLKIVDRNQQLNPRDGEGTEIIVFKALEKGETSVEFDWIQPNGIKTASNTKPLKFIIN